VVSLNKGEIKGSRGTENKRKEGPQENCLEKKGEDTRNPTEEGEKGGFIEKTQMISKRRGGNRVKELQEAFGEDFGEREKKVTLGA